MKKILFSLATLMVCTFGFISCSNENNANNEKDEDTIVGTWTLDKGQPVLSDLTIEPAEYAETIAPILPGIIASYINNMTFNEDNTITGNEYIKSYSFDDNTLTLNFIETVPGLTSLTCDCAIAGDKMEIKAEIPTIEIPTMQLSISGKLSATYTRK